MKLKAKNRINNDYFNFLQTNKQTKKVYVDELGLDRLEYIRHMCVSQHRNAQSSKQTIEIKIK